MASDDFSSDNVDPLDDATDDALENALAQNNYITMSQIAFEQSLRFHQREQYLAAVEYSDVALVAWRAHFDKASDEALAVARPTELRMINSAAAQNFNQGHFDIAIDLVQQARRLLMFMPPTLLTAATEWNTAGMEHWRGDHAKALQHALRALEIYRACGESSLNVPRLQLFIAQIAHSAAAASAQGSSRLVDRYLRVAHQHLFAVQPSSDSQHSPAVEAILRLVYSAYSRLTGRNEDRLGMLQSLLPLAHPLHDSSIVEGQIYAEMGDELSSQGREEESLTCYRIAVDILVASHAPVFAVWPWRALKKDWEYNLDRFAATLR